MVFKSFPKQVFRKYDKTYLVEISRKIISICPNLLTSNNLFDNLVTIQMNLAEKYSHNITLYKK